ncbi:hypothetical protein J6590_088572 [Homalodisca vitripennis]|nr:hypothetical protein J6590_088572 [Homalodisca vitripennis]
MKHSTLILLKRESYNQIVVHYLRYCVICWTETKIALNRDKDVPRLQTTGQSTLNSLKAATLYLLYPAPMNILAWRSSLKWIDDCHFLLGHKFSKGRVTKQIVFEIYRLCRPTRLHKDRNLILSPTDLRNFA